MMVKFFHFTNEKNKAPEVNDLSKSVTWQEGHRAGTEFRLPASSSRIRTVFNKIKCKTGGSNQDEKLAFGS